MEQRRKRIPDPMGNRGTNLVLCGRRREWMRQGFRRVGMVPFRKVALDTTV